MGRLWVLSHGSSPLVLWIKHEVACCVLWVLPLIGKSPVPVPVPVPSLHCNRGLLFVTGWPSITPRQGASGYARYAQVRREERATVLVLFNLCDLSRDTLRAAGFIGRCNSATITCALHGEAPDYLVGFRSRRANHRCSRLLSPCCRICSS